MWTPLILDGSLVFLFHALDTFDKCWSVILQKPLTSGSPVLPPCDTGSDVSAV